MSGNGKRGSRFPISVSLPQIGEKVPGIVIDCEPLRGFTKVEFTTHAIEQMKIRNLTRDEVLKTIRDPQETGLRTQANRQRFRRYRSKKRALDVIFEEHEDRIIVVTAMIVSLRGKDRQ